MKEKKILLTFINHKKGRSIFVYEFFFSFLILSPYGRSVDGMFVTDGQTN